MLFLLWCFFVDVTIDFIQSTHETFVKCDSHPIEDDINILMGES